MPEFKGGPKDGKKSPDNVKTGSGPVPMQKRLQSGEAVEPPHGQSREFGQISVFGASEERGISGSFEPRPSSKDFEGWLNESFRGLNYKIVRMLGKGGMGAVYEALYTGNPEVFGIPEGGRVAIKLLSAYLMGDHTEKSRFFREAAIIQNIVHPNAVKIYESGSVADMPFFAMEFLEGTSVESLIDAKAEAGKVVGVEKSFRIAYEVCSLLELAHSKGIIHRDIKPANLVIVKNGGERIKVIDLGVAKLMSAKKNQGLTEDGCALGTPVYMAPEAFNAKSVPASDIYSLGISMYEMICGSVPYEGEGYIDTAFFHMNTEPELMHERRQDLDVPEYVDTLVRCHMLAKNPEDRPTAAELMEEIEAYGLGTQKMPFVSVPNKVLTEAMPQKMEEAKPMVEKAKPKRKAKWAVAATAAAAAIAVAAAFFLAPWQAPAPEKERPAQNAKSGIYSVNIETDVPGVTVLKQEKLRSGTFSAAEDLGKTPLSRVQLERNGNYVLVFEEPGYETKLVEIERGNVVSGAPTGEITDEATFSIEMEKSE